jgi:hypothetical protein
MFSDEMKVDQVQRLVKRRLPADRIVQMQKEVSEFEIRNTLFAMKSNKSLGPDGFPVDFFKAVWSIVEDDVVQAMKSFFCYWEIAKGGQCNNYLFGS